MDDFEKTARQPDSLDLHEKIEQEQIKFVKEEMSKYFQNNSGKLKNHEGIEKKNDEYFVKIKFDKNRDKTLYGLLARGLKMSTKKWPGRTWDEISREICSLNGKKDFSMKEGELILIPIKKLKIGKSWEARLKKIETEQTAEYENLKKAEQLAKEKATINSKTSLEALDFSSHIYVPASDETFIEPQPYILPQNPAKIPESQKIFFSPPTPPVTEDFSKFSFSADSQKPRKFVAKANLTLKEARLSTPFLPKKELVNNLKELFKNPLAVAKQYLEADGNLSIDPEELQKKSKPDQFDHFCTIVRCGTTNNYLRENYYFDVKGNFYKIFSKLKPTMQQTTKIFARDFHDLNIQFYPDQKVSFTLAGGAEKRKNSSYHNVGKAIDIRTKDIHDIKKLTQGKRYLQLFAKLLNEEMNNHIANFFQEDRRLVGYRKTKGQTERHFHFDIKKDIDTHILETVSHKVRLLMGEQQPMKVKEKIV